MFGLGTLVFGFWFLVFGFWFLVFATLRIVTHARVFQQARRWVASRLILTGALPR
jgi:hypothetical protein